jgi:hypothetical protein
MRNASKNWSKQWKSVHATAIDQAAIDPRDHQMVALLHVHPHQDHRAAVHHRIVQALAVHLHPDLHLLARNLAKIVQLVAVAMTALAQHVKFRRAVMSAIHAGFVQLHKNVINREFVHASLNQIFLKMLQVKNSRRAFAQSC